VSQLGHPLLVSCATLGVTNPHTFHPMFYVQAAVEDEYVEAEAHNPSSSSKSSSSKADGSKGGGRKWWGQMGAAAKAALTSAKGSGPSPSGKPPSSSRSAARAAGGEAAAAQQKQRQERVHQMVSSALDVLLRLTPPPPGTDSCLKSLARPDVAPMRSLALPLMVAGDAVPALSGCMWSSWTDVATKVVSPAEAYGHVPLLGAAWFLS
jgi:hypothetical protein